MSQAMAWVQWLIGLAKPENLRVMAAAYGWVGYVLLTAIIFSETGLLIGFFLPGDSLLFATGFLASQRVFDLTLILTILSVAAIVGDALNYSLGHRAGVHVFEKGRLRFVKHEHLMAAKAFYDRHGGKAIILARFVPLVRTFTPFVAGVAGMNYRQFALYNIAGGIGWVVSMTMAGYFLGQIPWVEKNFEKVTLMIIFISILPVLIGAWKHRREVAAQQRATA
ncbi:VTT domain-containing protein [Planctomyces sp. SH-PL14]|uniref:VTT domain-containing protein n=1 Tax=Planctomyces sp. SH-PL14 TaxID=1632864 RepID=UPI00078E289F|nr:VTT domain-containing protein [Planctomyces sp. SH-PL14]AMV21093.1 Inner membrane protein YghB [Planctomyces sp. SH-PL14]